MMGIIPQAKPWTPPTLTVGKLDHSLHRGECRRSNTKSVRHLRGGHFLRSLGIGKKFAIRSLRLKITTKKVLEVTQYFELARGSFQALP